MGTIFNGDSHYATCKHNGRTKELVILKTDVMTQQHVIIFVIIL